MNALKRCYSPSNVVSAESLWPFFEGKHGVAANDAFGESIRIAVMLFLGLQFAATTCVVSAKILRTISLAYTSNFG